MTPGSSPAPLSRLDRRLALAIAATVSLLYAVLVIQPFATFDGASLAMSIITRTPAWMDGKPLYIWIGHGLYRAFSFLFDDVESLLALFGYYSAVSGGVTAGVSFLIIRRMAPESLWGAFVGVVLLVTAPMYLFTSVTIEVYLPNMMFIALAVLAWISGWFVLWGAFFGAAMASHALGALLTPLFLIDGLSERRRWVREPRFYVGALLAVAQPLVAYWWVVAANNGLDAFIQKYWRISKRDYFRGAKGTGDRLGNLWRATGPCLVALFVALPPLTWSWRDMRRNTLRLFLWAAPYAVFLLFWIQDTFFPAIGGQFYVYLVPPMAIGAALVVSRVETLLAERDRRLRFVFGAVMLVLGLATALPPTWRTLRAADGPHPYALFAKRVSSVLPKGAHILCMWESKILQVYRPDLRLEEWFGSRRAPGAEELARRMANWQRLLQRGQRVFVTVYWLRRISRVFPPQYAQILKRFELAYIQPELGEFKLQR